MSENVSPRKPKPLSAKQIQAAELLAADELTDLEIAASVRVADRTLYRWKKDPAFEEEVSRVAAELADVSRRYALGRRARRVQALTARWEKMLDVIEARGKDRGHRRAPGGSTGLLVRVQKALGSGENFQVVEEFTFDAALVRELREHEKQAAQELGQLVQKIAPTDPSGENGYDNLSDAELKRRIADVEQRIAQAQARASESAVGRGGDPSPPPA